jgi:ATP-dependent Clp protease ATP-binding subunit ClpB
LTESIRRNPYNVILFDEVEKAHPQVLNILLQVLDDGRLTDGKGRTVDFSNTVIILTSNLGSELLVPGEPISSQTRDAVMAVIKRHFRPEFLNRLDDVLLFHPLAQDHLLKIISVQMKAVKKRLAERNIEVIVDDDAVRFIGKVAYDPVYGARPLRRYLEKRVVTRLSVMLLGGELTEHSLVRIGVRDGDLVFSVEQPMRTD